MNLKKIAMMGFMAFFLTASVAAFAQDDKSQKKTPEEKAKMMTDKLKDKLSLTDEQYSKVEAATFDFISKKHALKEAEDKTGLDDKMKELQTEYHTTLQGILDEEQFKKFAEIESKNKEKEKDKS